MSGLARGALVAIAAAGLSACPMSNNADSVAPSTSTTAVVLSGRSGSGVPVVEYLEDPQHTLSFDEVRGFDAPSSLAWKQTRSPNFGYSLSRFWVRFSVRNQGVPTQEWFLEHGYPLIQHIEAHIFGDDGVETSYVAGKSLPFAARPVAHRKFLFPFTLRPNHSATVYLMIESTGTLRAPLRVLSAEALATSSSNEAVALGIYFGVISALILYNLFIFLTIRDGSYLYYILYTSSFGLAQACLGGLAYQYLWPGQVGLNQVCVPLLIGLSFLFLGLFTRKFIDTVKLVPRLDKPLLLLCVASGALVAVSVLHYGIFANKAASVLTTYAPLLALPAAIGCVRKGARPAGYYLLGFLAFFAGSALVAAKDLGVMPLNFFTVYGMHLGSAAEALLFSLGLADRIRTLKEDKVRMQTRADAVLQTTQMFAHDVRKPFSLMRALLGLLSDVKTVDEMSTTLSDVREEVLGATQSVDAMIQDVMEMGSSAPPVTAPLEQTELLWVTLKHFFLRPARAYDVRLTYRLGHHHKLQVHRAKVERVLLNIVGNALEAMHGRGELWFETREVDRKGRAFIEMAVGNSNSFIPPESIKKLFDPFFTSGKANGTGLGLVIVQKVVEAHGGAIECRSSRERGVEFTFALPAAAEVSTEDGVNPPSTAAEMAATVTPHQARPKPALAEAVAPAAPEVILVEDSGTHRAAWLARLPPGSLGAYETPEGLLAATEAEPDLLTRARFFVLDQNFPPGSMLGTQLAERLRPRTTARILLCSSHTVTDLPASIDGVLPKRAHGLAELEALGKREGTPPDSVRSGGHVVLVEDSRTVQRAWRQRLPQGALRVFDGPSALLAAFQEHPSVLTSAVCVVLDNHFAEGEMRGDDLAVELRDRRLTPAPVLLSSDEDSPVLPPGVHARIPKGALGREELAAVLSGLPAA